MTWISIFGALAAALILAMILTPRTVDYVETIEINASARRLYDTTRHQADLMRWSAWLSTTGSQCSVAGPDGQLGARTVFLSKDGKPFGHQEIIALTEDRSVALTLESKGPPQKPVLTFYFLPLEEERTLVLLHFCNPITPPFHLALKLFGVVDWTRGMHRKDLEGLKRYNEPPFQTYTGEPA